MKKMLLEDKDIIENLKFSIEYFEKRISLYDSKSNILLVVVSLIATLLIKILETFKINDVLSNAHNFYYYFIIILLILIFIFFVSSVILLIQTIRPSKKYFGFEVPKPEYKVDNNLFGFSKDFPNTKEKYLEKINKFDSDSLKDNYYRMHFITEHLLFRKHMFYEWAVYSMKLFIVFVLFCQASVFFKWFW